MIFISMHENITIKDVRSNPDIRWNYTYLSRNANITMKDIKENPDIRWDYYMVIV